MFNFINILVTHVHIILHFRVHGIFNFFNLTVRNILLIILYFLFVVKIDLAEM